MDFEWSAERLNELKKRSGLTTEKLSQASGVSISALNSYLHGRMRPGMDALVQLADFFAVPMDYLLGRLDEETAKDIEEHYSERFMELRRAPYEAYLTGRYDSLRNRMSSEIEAPWPYNLLDVLKNTERWDTPLNDDQMDGLEHAISFLNDRARSHIYEYYKNGKTLEQVAQMHGITRERTRQIITKAVHSLRHPVRMRYIYQGLKGADEIDEYSRRLEKVRMESRELDAIERELVLRSDALMARRKALEGTPANFRMAGEDSVESMDLSVRSYNCLSRAGAKSVYDVIALARSGKLSTVRNLGIRSIAEILDKLNAICGEDYYYLYPRARGMSAARITW